ncbi:uncharacterized protein LOC117831078 isoform X1 [Xyrichtys novacula]|uniref:Uncharacterized protein LOC117831078 isoform X1 n=1 Tax=Xyrichtys novacula TaxID=13765 RepID=A0AAV1GCH7_XYRNO|nr:uncharacterized protein LOC117831078 isoform X1 [Xyrichtys novacula]
MRMCQLLQLTVVLVGLCQAHSAPPTTVSHNAGMVPVAQVRMLSLGLAHLLQGVKESAKWLEQQGEQVEAELDGAVRGVESLRKQNFQAGRTRRQVRKDLQILRARGDRLWRTVKDLQKGLEDLELEHGDIQQQMDRIFQQMKSLSEPRSRGKSQLDISSVKDVIAKQARQLNSLTSAVSAQDGMIDRRQKHIEHLEKQVSKRLPAALRAESDSDTV